MERLRAAVGSSPDGGHIRIVEGVAMAAGGAFCDDPAVSLILRKGLLPGGLRLGGRSRLRLLLRSARTAAGSGQQKTYRQQKRQKPEGTILSVNYNNTPLYTDNVYGTDGLSRLHKNKRNYRICRWLFPFATHKYLCNGTDLRDCIYCYHIRATHHKRYAFFLWSQHCNAHIVQPEQQQMMTRTRRKAKETQRTHT